MIGVGYAHYLFLVTTTIMILCDILTLDEFIHGFSNEGMMTIGFLFAIVTPVSKTGILQWFTRRVFIFKRFPVFNLVILMFTCGFLSMWMNNTPIVALFIPIIKEWCTRENLPASKFLIPMSYATIAGGTVTIIGTSTNLVVNGFLENIKQPGFGFFELGMLAGPMCVVLLVWVLFAGYWLLPNNKNTQKDSNGSVVNFLAEVPVLERSYLVGRSIQNVQDKYMVEVNEILRRDSENTIPCLNDVLKVGDIIFVLAPQKELVDFLDMISLDGSDLHKSQVIDSSSKFSGYAVNPGEEIDEPLLETKEKKSFLDYFRSKPETKYQIYQVILSDQNPYLSSRLKDYTFQRKYGVSVFGIRQNGKELFNIHEYSMKMGDALIVVGTEEFFMWADSTDFYSIQKLETSKVAKEEKIIVKFWAKKYDVSLWKLISIPIFITMIACAAAGFPMFMCAMITLMVFITLGIIDGADAVDCIDFKLLILIAASFGIGKGIQNSYLADTLSRAIVRIPFPYYMLPAVVFFLTQTVSATVTNNAAAAIMFPVAMSLANEAGLNLRPFAVAVSFI